MSRHSPSAHRYVGRVVHALRRERGMHQSELASLTGLKQPNLSRIENGLVVPRRGTLEKLAIALGVTVADLLNPEKIREVETQWSAALTPRNAGQIFAGQMSAVPFFGGAALSEIEFDAAGRPVSKPSLILQLPPIPGRVFALPVPDDSMQTRGAGRDSFAPGEVLVFSDTPTVRTGDFALVVAPELRALRKVHFESHGERLRFVPLNRSFPPVTLPRKAIQGLWRLVRRLREY